MERKTDGEKEERRKEERGKKDKRANEREKNAASLSPSPHLAFVWKKNKREKKRDQREKKKKGKKRARPSYEHVPSSPPPRHSSLTKMTRGPRGGGRGGGEGGGGGGGARDPVTIIREAVGGGVDEADIKEALEDAGGDVNEAVARLVDSEFAFVVCFGFL